jgi:hypothetical protein
LGAFALIFIAWSCSSSKPSANPISDFMPEAGTEASPDAAGHGGSSGFAGSSGHGGTAGKDAGGAAGAADAADAADASPVDAGGDGDAIEEVPASCSNGVLDGNESDTDCGGSCPTKCGPGKDCSLPADCADKNCVEDKCMAATCTDGIQNGNETDIDCGGSPCDLCDDNKTCVGAANCKSGVCTSDICQPPSCTDKTKNGTETDVDCGGSCQHKCPTGQKCLGSGDCTSQICNSNVCDCPSKMIVAPSPGGGSYCIDVTEVTYKDYTAFFNANPQNQPSYCLWNLTYVPADNWPAAPADSGKPVVDVDWCDAYAYCGWAGKRLCGNSLGGASGITDYKDPAKSMWFNACSAQGVNEYPYGHTYKPTECNGAEYSDSFGGTYVVRTDYGDVPTGHGCAGGSPGLYDMSGDVAEWEDSCSGAIGSSDSCRIRGGSFESSAADLRCDADKQLTRDGHAADVGFRCCL